MLRILIVDDPNVSYRPFRKQLQEEEEMRIVSVVDTVAEARLHLRYSDVVLVGNALPEAPGLVEEISKEQPEVNVLVSGVEEEVEQILRYVEAGADGYLGREESAERMVQKIEATTAGEALVSPRVAASLLSRVAALSDYVPATVHHSLSEVEYEELTPRQSEVLELLHDELSNRQIANRLHIQLGTVKNHVHHILKKLDVQDRYEAAAAYGRWLRQEGSREAYVTL